MLAHATYNEGDEGMVKLNRVVHQRFDHILWDYDPKVEEKLVDSQHVRLIGTAFRVARKERKITQPIGTAVLQRFQRNMNSFGVDMAVEIFLGMFDSRERPLAKEILERGDHQQPARRGPQGCRAGGEACGGQASHAHQRPERGHAR